MGFPIMRPPRCKPAVLVQPLCFHTGDDVATQEDGRSAPREPFFSFPRLRATEALRAAAALEVMIAHAHSSAVISHLLMAVLVAGPRSNGALTQPKTCLQGRLSPTSLTTCGFWASLKWLEGHLCRAARRAMVFEPIKSVSKLNGVRSELAPAAFERSAIRPVPCW